MPNRLLIFVHYNKYSDLADHVVYTLEHIRDLFSRIVFVSNSPLRGDHKDTLGRFCDKITERENRGFDFGGWRDGLSEEGWDGVAQYDSVTLMNDTCFGPLWDVEPVYRDMENRDIDFWGLTNHRETNEGLWAGKPVPPYIQSYFVCFHRNVVQSNAFGKFWRRKKRKGGKRVIQDYLKRLTTLLTKAGFQSAVLCDTAGKGMEKDAALFHPDVCIEQHVPFVKVKGFRYHNYPKYVIGLIRKLSGYPVSLIEEHITQTFIPSESLFICDKVLSDPAVNRSPALKTAIHLHVFYLDIFEKYAACFDALPFPFDLFITTPDREKKEAIENYLRNHKTWDSLKEIIITENKGRDIIPWLSIAGKLEAYDVAGHFHTKKSSASETFIGLVWQQDLLDMLLGKASSIITALEEHDDLGMVIPDIPRYFHIKTIKYYFELVLNKKLNDLWRRMGCKKSMDFTGEPVHIMPYGTMFWYRPAALRRLCSLNLSPEEIPPEPISPHGTILHCIERILVYAAWDAGFDYRIVPLENPFSGFVDSVVWNRVLKDRMGSPEYRIGSAVMVIPRGIKKTIKFLVPKSIKLKLKALLLKSD